MTSDVIGVAGPPAADGLHPILRAKEHRRLLDMRLRRTQIVGRAHAHRRQRSLALCLLTAGHPGRQDRHQQQHERQHHHCSGKDGAARGGRNLRHCALGRRSCRPSGRVHHLSGHRRPTPGCRCASTTRNTRACPRCLPGRTPTNGAGPTCRATPEPGRSPIHIHLASRGHLGVHP